MRDLAAASEREGRDREATSLRAAADIFERHARAYDDSAETRQDDGRLPPVRAGACVLGGVAAVLVAVGARLLAESPAAGRLALGGAVACVIAAVALAVSRAE